MFSCCWNSQSQLRHHTMRPVEIRWPWICIRKTVPLWGGNRFERLFPPSTAKLPQGSGSFSDLVMEVGIYIRLLWHSCSPPQFLTAGSHVLWKCGLGLSLIWKNFFVAYALSIQWETCEKTRNLCIMKFLKALHNMPWPFNVPVWASIKCICRWESFSEKHSWPISH